MSLAAAATSSEDIRERLQVVLAREVGGTGRVSGLRRLREGATRSTWVFDAELGKGLERLVMQRAPPPPSPHSGDSTVDPQSLVPRVKGGDDAAMVSAAALSGVPVPPIRCVPRIEDGLGFCCITDFVAGETLGHRIVRDPEYAMARRDMSRQCGQILARIHAIPPAHVPFLHRQDPERVVEIWKAIYESLDHPLPALDLGFRWAEDNLPGRSLTSGTAVVHGDFRNGNLIVTAKGIQAVLDWEVAHIGDPLEDLGWLCVNTWRFGGSSPVGGFGDRAPLFRAYEAASGRAVDPMDVRFWEGFGSIKWGVMCMSKGQRSLREGELSVENAALGRRVEEPILDFLDLLFPASIR